MGPLLNEVLVSLLADEISVGEKVWNLAAHLAGEFLIGDLEAHALGFQDQCLLDDETVSSFLVEERHHLIGHIAFGELLLADVARLQLDIGSENLLVADGGHDIGASPEVGGRTARDQSDDHRGTNDEKQTAQNELFGPARSLQKTNHVGKSSECSSETLIIKEKLLRQRARREQRPFQQIATRSRDGRRRGRSDAEPRKLRRVWHCA